MPRSDCSGRGVTAMKTRTSFDEALLNDVLQWDVQTWRRALSLWQAVVNDLRPSEALAIGERGGGLSLWLARQDIAVLCTDVDGFGPNTRMLHVGYGVGDRIRYASEDATALTVADSSFGLVIFKSVLGALGTRERQAEAIREVHRVLKPGGALLFAENLVGTGFHAWLRRRFVRWESGWRYLRYPRDLELFDDFRSVETRTTGLLAALGRSEKQRGILARMDTILCPITPSSWHYVVYGACRKDT